MIARRGMLALGAAALALPVPAARAIQVPHGRSRPDLTLLVGAPPGSTVDRVARAFAASLSRQLTTTDLTIRNLPGEGGLRAIRALADAAPDGGTLGWVASPTLPARTVDRDAAPLLHRLRLLGAVQKEPIVFVSPPATPIETVQNLVSRSGEDADAVPLGTPPPGSPPHLAALKLQALAGTRLNIITFPSAAAAHQAALGGNLAAAALGMAEAIADLRAERLVGLGIAARDRIDALPDVPAVNEAGPALSALITRGLAAPAGLPEEAAAGVTAALQAVVADLAFRDDADAGGIRVVWIDGARWTAMVEAEHDRLARLWSTEPWLETAGQ